MTDSLSILAPGDRSPSFSLPAVNRDGLVSLEDYRRRNPVLLSVSGESTDLSAVASSCSWPWYSRILRLVGWQPWWSSIR